MAAKRKAATTKRAAPKTRSITIPADDEGIGVTAWAIGNKALRWILGSVILLAAGAAAWHQLGWWTPASVTYVHETVKPLDLGIKTLAVGNLQNRIETLSSRRAQAYQAKSEKQLQLRASQQKQGQEDLNRILQEQIDVLDQAIRDLDKQIDELQQQVRLRSQ